MRTNTTDNIKNGLKIKSALLLTIALFATACPLTEEDEQPLDTTTLLIAPVTALQGEREVCATRAPTSGTASVFYEIIDIFYRQVWGTPDFTPDEFAAFAFPYPWLLWQKNDPRVPQPDSAQFLKSPGCGANGQYTYLRAFGKEFLQVVQLISVNEALDAQNLVRRTTLEKYHTLTYNSGRTVNVLNSPTGDRYILVARTANPISPVPTLPAGWTLSNHVLAAPLNVDLSGTVSVLRTDNEDSYQGPLPISLTF